MSNTSINLVGLDFETIKGNLIDYLKRSDSPFKDVNFEGSNISQLLDVLSYNTYLNSYYLNMVGSEMFLDSAQLRESIVSHAKELNYVPRSFTSSSAHVSFNIYPSTPLNSILVPKGTTFTTKLGSNSYTFSTGENLIFNSSSNGVIVIDDLEIFEGNYLTDTFVFDSTNTAQRFVLSNPTVDTRSISVLVLENSGANTYTYNRATSFLGVNANTKCYFLQAAENYQYEILFGDNVIGRKPLNGATVLVEYRVCNGELPNGSSAFFLDGPIQSQTNVSPIAVISAASGGSVNESDDSIKYNAPRAYQNQERAVTTSDYENLLLQNFPEIQAISAYGGDTVSPPQYGKVFISVDVVGSEGTPDLTKRKFYNFIKSRSPLSIDPVIVEPEFLYVEVASNVQYNINITSLKDNDIKSLVALSISNFNQTYLQNFKSTLRFSKFLKVIDDTHPSILSNETTVVPFKSLQPIRGTEYTTTISFGYAITNNIIQDIPGTTTRPFNAVHNIRSSVFRKNNADYFLEDDGQGNLYTITLQGSDHKKIAKIGTVNYTSGTVNISNLLIDDYTGSEIKLYATPVHKDINSDKNVILLIRDEDVTVTVSPVRI